jgi:hypothetical protein
MSSDAGDAATPAFIKAVHELSTVPVEFLTGDTIDAVWDSAQRFVDWAASAQPAPQPTSAVPVPPLSRPVDMRGEAPDDWMVAWRSGRLGGIPAPPPRRTGEQHRNAAP